VGINGTLKVVVVVVVVVGVVASVSVWMQMHVKRVNASQSFTQGTENEYKRRLKRNFHF